MTGTKENEKWKKQADLALRILENCRNELYRYFPYLDGAFASLVYQAVQKKGMGTDGEFFYFEPACVIRKYRENPAQVKRGYLHLLLHCLLGQVFFEDDVEKRMWHLACDIAVEHMIEQEQISALGEAAGTLKGEVFALLQGKSYSAQKIYTLLEKKAFSYSLEELEQAFVFDDHDFWNTADMGKGVRIRRKWERIRSYTAQNKEHAQSSAGTQKGDAEEELQVTGSGKYDYKKFLRKFSVLREEVEIDTESFDYVFYNYGMETYGNMPLIEHLEYKEVNRLEELVIAIDTSGSCSKEVVQQFLEETYAIFNEKENFFNKMKVYFMQCDCCLQQVSVIHSREEWLEYSKNIVIEGRAGTNFQPVFRYVEELREKKELKNLKALIYFTDGDGVYPDPTDYETAFVFVRADARMDLVPAWATKLLV